MNASLRLLVCALFLFADKIKAQTPSITGPALPGLEHFDTAMANLMAKYNSPGAQLALARNGRLVLARGYGYADRDAGEPVQPDSLFRIASNSKPLTGLAILALIEQGRLSLDTKVIPFLGLTALPGATNLDARWQTVTVQHLLNHTSGWDTAVSGDLVFSSTTIATAAAVPAPADVDSIIRYHLGRRLDFDPGTRYAYANFNYVTLGRIIEKAGGQSYSAYVQAHVLAKAGVTRAVPSRSLLRDRHPGEVRYYDYPGAPLTASVFPPTNVLVPWTYGGINYEAIQATGGWAISAVDYVRLLCALDGSKPGPAAILSPASIDLWTAPPPAPVSVGASAYYGMGVQARNSGAGVGLRADWYHAGSLPGTVSYMLRLPGGWTYAVVFNTRAPNGPGMAGEISGTLNFLLSLTTPPATGDLFLSSRPEIIAAPESRNVNTGATVTLSSTISSVTTPTYQWFKDGAAITGATNATLSLANVSAADAANYNVVATNAAGPTASSAATLSVGPVVGTGRLINLSILTSLAGAADSFTMGYVVGGAGTTGGKPLVIRAAGPSLSALGITNALADPKVELFAGATKTLENDNWGGLSTVADAMTAVGAFAFTGLTSRDSALAISTSQRDNSVKVSPVGNLSGAVLAEVYDATPAASFTATTPRLINVSVLKHIGTSLSAGFVIGGTSSRTVLIRAVGPTLGAAFGLGGVVADPQIVLFNAAAAKIGENDNWGGGTALAAAFTSVGAFELPAASRDAALLVTLAPGNYSVQVSGVGNTTGTALVEVYEVP